MGGGRGGRGGGSSSGGNTVSSGLLISAESGTSGSRGGGILGSESSAPAVSTPGADARTVTSVVRLRGTAVVGGVAEGSPGAGGGFTAAVVGGGSGRVAVSVGSVLSPPQAVASRATKSHNPRIRVIGRRDATAPKQDDLVIPLPSLRGRHRPVRFRAGQTAGPLHCRRQHTAQPLRQGGIGCATAAAIVGVARLSRRTSPATVLRFGVRTRSWICGSRPSAPTVPLSRDGRGRAAPGRAHGPGAV